MVAFGAIHAGMRNARRRRTAAAGARRRKAAQDRVKQQREIEQRLDIVFKKYDTDRSGYLDRSQVTNIMTDLDSSTPPGTKPSEDEITFVMSESAGDDSQVSREELGQTIALWASYVREKVAVEQAWDRHDKDKTGTLSGDQLKSLLTELNEGEEVAQEEVDLLMAEFDSDKSGDLKRVEATKAVHCWYVAHEDDEEKPSSGCCVIS